MPVVSHRALPRRPREPRTCSSALLLGSFVRIPVFSAGVLLTVHVVVHPGRSYAAAGLLAAVATVAIAVSGPWRGRLLDRIGLRRVVLPSTVVALVCWSVAPWVGYLPLLVLGGRGRAVRHPHLLDHPSGRHRRGADAGASHGDLARRRRRRDRPSSSDRPRRSGRRPTGTRGGCSSPSRCSASSGAPPCGRRTLCCAPRPRTATRWMRRRGRRTGSGCPSSPSACRGVRDLRAVRHGPRDRGADA